MKNLPPTPAVFNVCLRSTYRHFLLLGAIALSTGLIHAGEQKDVFSGNFSKGNLDGWSTSPSIVAIPGEGLESTDQNSFITRRLKRSTSKKEGKWIYKAKVWPKGERASCIEIGFFPYEHSQDHRGLSVIIHANGDVYLHSGPAKEGKLTGVSFNRLGKLPYSVELAYTTTPPTATLTINGEVFAYDILTAYGGVTGTPPPEESFAFAGILFRKQNEPKNGGRVESASVEWVPSR